MKGGLGPWHAAPFVSFSPGATVRWIGGNRSNPLRHETDSLFQGAQKERAVGLLPLRCWADRLFPDGKNASALKAATGKG